ncbi:MAG: S8 family serine peptidase, partial [Steroidobacteraceae bacterium]
MRAAGVPIFSVPIWLLVSSTFVFAAEPTAIHQVAHGVTTTYVVPPSKLLNLDSPNRVPNQYTVVFKKDSDLLMLSASDVAGLKIAPGLLPLSQESTNTLVKAMIGWYQALDGANSTVLHVWWQFGVHGFEVKDLPDSDIADLAQDPRIEFIEADVYATTSTTIQYGAPWHLDRLDQLSGTDGLYHYDALGFSSFIYVIDSGIQADHSEFSALGEIEVFSCLTSECTLVGQSDQFDCWGHGTAVASVIGGATFGVAKAALMTALGVTDCVKGSATPGAIITAIQKTESDAALYTNFSFIINMSLNFPIVVPSVDVEINNAINQGITVIVSAGNSNIDACNSTPTDNDDARAIRVGATDATDTRWSLSNYGSCVDIFAPG